LNVFLVALKSYGDFIIARWVLRAAAGEPESPALLMGDHLRELNDALGSYPRSLCLRHGEAGVPALFDLSKAGLRRGTCSGLRLKRMVRALALPSNSTLIFDRNGWRERFIAGSIEARGLPAATNIYVAYCTLLGIALPVRFHNGRASHDMTRIGLFPDSRVAAKCVPADVIQRVIDACRSRALHPVIFRLQGESSPLPSMGVETCTVPRQFAAMADAIHSVHAVVSADSMPAHMAEYLNRPVFVISPVRNDYWLPLSSFEKERWSLFAEGSTAMDRLSAFLFAIQGAGSMKQATPQ
jgi:hypothetical protein